MQAEIQRRRQLHNFKITTKTSRFKHEFDVTGAIKHVWLVSQKPRTGNIVRVNEEHSVVRLLIVGHRLEK